MPNWIRMTVEQANKMYGNLGYQVTEDINNGTFKQVFRATFKGKEIALKVIQLDGGSIGFRTHREIELMLSIDSPYVAKIIDYNLGSMSYKAYVAEEFISRNSLDQRFKQGIFTLPEYFQILGDVFQSLIACAEKNIVHRDVKPQNILLKDVGTAVLTDFGLARPLDESTVTASGIAIGTLAYSPPECIKYNSDLLNQTSDLFSFGVMAYYLLTRKHPFIVDSIRSPEVQMLETEAIPPSDFDTGIDQDLSKFIMKLIRREVSERYPSTQFAYKRFEKLREKIIG